MSQTAPLIYIVEDHREIRLVLEELLLDVGYRVFGCSTAREVRERISVTLPDLLLLDNHLEQYAAGWNMLTVLRTNEATATIPIILVSADVQFLRLHSEELHAQRCFVIEKPFDLDDILTTVYAALGIVAAESEVAKI
jgi:CheY-like chemotaxis protein